LLNLKADAIVRTADLYLFLSFYTPLDQNQFVAGHYGYNYKY